MALYKRSNGIYYYWYFDERNVRQKVSTHTGVEREAQKFVLDFERKRLQPEDTQTVHRQKKPTVQPQKTEPARYTLKRFTQEFLRHSEIVHARKTTKGYHTALVDFGRYVGDTPLNAINLRLIEEYVCSLKSRISEVTVRTYFVHLAAAFEQARRWQHITSNPFKEMRRPRLPERQPIYLRQCEFSQVLAAAKNRLMREIFTIAVLTGLRLGELMALEWTDVNFDQRTVLVQNKQDFKTKSRKNRVIPLSSQAYALLQERKARSRWPRVFQDAWKSPSGDTVSGAFKNAVRAAGVDKRIHFHSLRHTFASWLVESGVSLYEVQKLLGHQSISTTEIYAHLAPCKLHGTVERISLNINDNRG